MLLFVVAGDGSKRGRDLHGNGRPADAAGGSAVNPAGADPIQVDQVGGVHTAVRAAAGGRAARAWLRIALI